MGKGKYLNKKEVIKALKKWIKAHAEDSNYNLSIGKNFNLSQKGTGMDDSQFEIVLKRFDRIDNRLYKIEKVVKKNHPNDFKKNSLKIINSTRYFSLFKI